MALPTLHPPTTPDSGPGAPAADLAPTATDGGDRRGRAGRRAALAALLAATAALYLWHLSASGYANTFYAAAAQAGSESWKAFFFGSLDAGNAITVDKPPASLWLMALSVRIFGLSSWSLLVPQALLGVASVGILYATVRRTSGHLAGLVAGALLAITPVAVLMFRFNNPDALLVFLMTLAAWATLRATERASARWLAGAGVLIGFAFLTKMLQAFLVLPAFALVYLIAAPTPLRRRLLHLLGAFGAMLLSLGWWVAIVELVPASWRPYVGGSADNSVLDLIVGYNGLGRVFGAGGPAGASPGGTGPGGGGSSFGSEAGITRMFAGVSGGMVSWLIPAALILGAAALVLARRLPRTDLPRAGVVIWAGWLVVSALVFSFMAGIYHDYYTVALAPAIAGLFAVGGATVWRHRATWTARIALALATAAGAAWAFVLLGEATGVYQALRWPVVATAAIAAPALLLAHRLPRAAASVVLGLALAGTSAGPAAYALNTAATPHTGSIVTAGPVQGSGFGGPGGAARDGQLRRADGQWSAGSPFPQPPQGSGTAQAPSPTGGTGGPAAGTSAGGRPGERAADPDLTDLLAADAGAGYTWSAATVGSQGAASYQLASGQAVMAIGGFTGADPSPTLEQFQGLVAHGRIHYFISDGDRMGGPGGDRGTGSAITTWVSENFASSTVGTATVYDLTQAK